MPPWWKHPYQSRCPLRLQALSSNATPCGNCRRRLDSLVSPAWKSQQKAHMAVEIARTQRKTEARIPILNLQNWERKNSKSVSSVSSVANVNLSSGSTATRDTANWHNVNPFKIYFRICFYIARSHHLYRYLLATTSAQLLNETSSKWCWEQEESC